MPVMPPSNTSQPLPLANLPRLRAYRKSAEPAGGEPVRPHKDAFIGDQSKYINPHAPESSIPGYDEGYSPALRIGSEGTTPDDIRIHRREPPPHTNNPRFHKVRNADFLARRAMHDREITTGWPIQQTRDAVPQSIPMSADQPARRWTAITSPNTEYFVRDDHHRTPEFTGEHLSLADHRRVYAVMGQKPQGRLGVNTYRAEPRPWDESLYTAPLMAETGERAQALPVSRSYRASGVVTSG